MLQQHAFDLCRSDREALILHHLLAAIDHEVEASLIHAHDVSRPVPAVAHHRGRGIGRLPISQHELRATHDQLAQFALRNIVAIFIEHPAISLSYGTADRTAVIELGIEIAHVGDRRSFGHAVSLAYGYARGSGKAARQIRRQRGRATLHPAQTVLAWKLSRIASMAVRQQRRWYTERHGHAFLNNGS